MTQEASKDHSVRWVRPARGTERRLRTRMSPPPYRTTEGIVLLDRRSYIDRRSSWIRDFSIEPGEPESN